MSGESGKSVINPCFVELGFLSESICNKHGMYTTPFRVFLKKEGLTVSSRAAPLYMVGIIPIGLLEGEGARF
jgi:hypothetical protein